MVGLRPSQQRQPLRTAYSVFYLRESNRWCSQLVCNNNSANSLGRVAEVTTGNRLNRHLPRQHAKEEVDAASFFKIVILT